MAIIVDPERLKQMRKDRGLTQEALAERAHVDKQTIYRMEREQKPRRQKIVERVAKALPAELSDLTGDEPIPKVPGHQDADAEASSYQLNVRVNAPVRNAFELVARRYRVSTTKIAQLAPLLFAIIAEETLQDRRRKLGEFEDQLGRLRELEQNFPGACIYSGDAEGFIEKEETSINNRDLFDSKGIFGFDAVDTNPFSTYLAALTSRHDDISVRAIKPAATEYRVCRSEAMELAANDPEIAEWLLNGEVPIHRMPRGMKSVEERTEWMRQHRSGAVHKATDQVTDGYPGDLIDEVTVIDPDLL
jgi:transcriptional regulator with XRE-family HTH domain